MDKKTLVQLLKPYLSRQKEIDIAYLYGSFATGQAKTLSDVDIGILFNQNVSSNDYFDLRLRLIGEISDLLRFDHVDAAVLNEAPPLLAYQIVTKGEILFAANPEIVIAAAMRAFSLYFDFLPVLEYFNEKIITGKYGKQ